VENGTTISASASSRVREHRKTQLAERLAWEPAYTESGLVITREDGSPVHPTILSKQFAARVHRAGLPPIRFHDLRHGYATLALAAGTHPKVVQEQLGHASITMTLDTYSSVLPGLAGRAAEAIGSAVFDLASDGV
jgi:integrase